MPNSADLVTDLPADFEVFGQAVATSMADLLGGTTGQVLSKTTNTDMDFTWVSPNPGDITAVNVTSPITGGGSSGDVTIGIQAGSTTQSGAVQLTDSTSSTSTTTAATPNAVKTSYDLANAAIAKTTVTTAGDIIYRNATVPTRLGIGTAGQVLKVNSGATAPEWATASSGSYTLIKRATTTGAVNTGTTYDDVFTSTYKAYKIVIEKWISATAADDPLFQLRYAGPTTQAADYYGANGVLGRDNVWIYNPSVTTTALIMSENIGDSWGSHYEMTVTQVGNASEKPSGFYSGNRQANQSVILGSLYNDTARTYTGFILSCASNLTVTVAVYGLATA
jgi:hypothetical protein